MKSIINAKTEYTTSEVLLSIPYAEAAIAGKAMYPDISGSVMFYEVYGGTLVVVSVKNLSDENERECKTGTSIIQRKIVLLLSNVTSVIKTQY